MRVGFLFNHDQVHQVAHSLPVALALARNFPQIEIILATTSERLARQIERLSGGALPKSISIRALGLKSLFSRGAKAAFGRMVPAARFLVYRDNLDFFRSLDVLVVTERTSLILKTRFRLDRPALVLTDHGAGDRAIGFGESTALYDHILAAGPKIKDRLTREAGVLPDRISITGYPKFDSPAGRVRPLKFRESDKPIVLYNPHLSPHLSSWYKEGRAVLDYFLSSDRYNLIFAPHIMLFERGISFSLDKFRFALPGSLRARYGSAPNIHVDLGSPALTDMTYTNCADIYLGDVSSQVYEFLKSPRPCAFINAHGLPWEGDPNFAHWNAGPVIARAESLDGALADAVRNHPSAYAAAQQKLFDYTFDLQDEPSSERAARVIAGLLGLRSRV